MKALSMPPSLKPAPSSNSVAQGLFGPRRAWALRSWEGAARWTLVALWAAGVIASLHPDARSALRAAALPDYRAVVSTAQAHLLGGAALFTVAKIKTRDSLFLEIYEKKAEGVARLVEKIPLADKRDGYFNFNGRATNLAVADIDGDGKPEILAPSFDEDLVGRLNVFRFDPPAKHEKTESLVR